MARVFSENVTEIVIRGRYASRDVVNVLHFYNDEGAVNDPTKARDVLNAWQGEIMNIMSNDYGLVGADWRSLDPDDNNAGYLAPDPTKLIVGGQTGAGAPPNVAYLAKKVTPNRPRGKRDGRIFIAGVPELQINNRGVIEPTHLASCNTRLQAFLDAVNDDQWGVGGGSGLVVLEAPPESRIPGTQPVTVPYRAVTSLVMDPLVATQRDRLR